jgi:hypothetical protein
MEPSIFPDKTKIPDDLMLREALGAVYSAWMEIRDYVFRVYPKSAEEWNSPGQKYGWSFRIKDKKRAIIYLLPRDKYFLVAFVFGANATTEALASGIIKGFKSTIESARVYAEGRGFRIEVRDDAVLKDIKTLIDVKLAN